MKYTDSKEVIPICVMERAIVGINNAEACDQAHSSDYELRRALKRVIEWYKAPCYQWELDACRKIGLLEDT